MRPFLIAFVVLLKVDYPVKFPNIYMELTCTLIQSQLAWENKSANKQHLNKKMETLSGKTDLVILPEMFSTGFSMNSAALAENMDGPTVQWMQAWAQTLGAAVCGSLIIEENSHYCNRFLLVEPNGSIQFYDKRHLFTLAREERFYTKGQNKVLMPYAGWRICPQVCYDLRFPAWSRNLENYDLLIYVANWPKTRRAHWRSLLKARAIENQSFVIGVNRVGTDGNGLDYTGHSALIDFSGHVFYEADSVEDVFSFTLRKADQDLYRSKFPFLTDRDNFSISS